MEPRGANLEGNAMKKNFKTGIFALLLSGLGIFLFIQYIATASSPSGGGTPGGVSANLQLWLKADAGTSTTTNGANVFSWIDQSPNSWTADNSADNEPIYNTNAINFNPALNFGLNGRSELSINNGYPQSPPGSSGLTIFSVFKPISDTSKNNFILDVGQISSAGYGIAASVGTYSAYNSLTNSGGPGSGDENAVLGSSLGERPALLTHEIQFGLGRISSINANPISSTTNLVLTRLDSNNVDFSPNHQSSSGPLTIGRTSKDGHINTNNGRYFRGDIAEIIIYNADISGTDKTKIESYLAVKYGITLIDTVNYIASDGTIVYPSLGSHSNFTHDIAGIAVDGGSDLVQTASRSVNEDSVVTVTGTLAAMNSGEYLIWGNNDDNFNPSPDVPILAPSPQRLTRIWRAAETGDVGNVTISFDLSVISGDFDFSHPAGFALLVDNDSIFNNATIITGASINGEVVSFNGVNFDDDDYFSLVYPTNAIQGLTAENDSPTIIGGTTNFTATIVNGSNVTYSWDFGDGKSGSGPNVSHMYTSAGEFTATVTASNNVNTLMQTTTAIVIEESVKYHLYIPVMYQYPELFNEME